MANWWDALEAAPDFSNVQGGVSSTAPAVGNWWDALEAAPSAPSSGASILGGNAAMAGDAGVPDFGNQGAPAPALRNDGRPLAAGDFIMDGSEVPRLDSNGALASAPTNRDVLALQQATGRGASPQAPADPFLSAPSAPARGGLMDSGALDAANAQFGGGGFPRLGGAADFDARFGRGAAQQYIGADAAPRPDAGPWWREQLGANGRMSYDLIDNPLTRGLAQAGNTAATGLSWVVGKGVGAVSRAAGQWWDRTQTQPLAAQAEQLRAPADAGVLAAGTQALTNLGGQLAIGGAFGGVGATADAAGMGLMGAARQAVANPATRMAGALGVSQAGSEAAQLDAEGHPISLSQFGTMAATDTAANLVPLAGRWNLPARVASGAVVGEGTNEASNIAAGRPVGTGAMMATGFGAALGVLPGHHNVTIADEGRALANQVLFGNRVDFLRDATARQDLDERMAAVAQHGGGAVHPAIAQRLADAVANEHGVSVDNLVSAPRNAMEAGTAAADQMLADMQQVVSVPEAPTVIRPNVLASAAPRAPALPDVQPGVSRDDLVQRWNAAQTDVEKAAAAASIHAFDVQARQQPTEATLAPAWAAEIDNHPGLAESVRAGLRDRYTSAAQTLPVFDADVREIADSVGGRAVVAPLKGVDRAAAKLLGDYEGDASKLKDLVRGTIEIPSHTDTRSVIDQLRAKYGDPIKLKNNLDPAQPPPFANGYRDINSVWSINGEPVEVQINVPEMLAAKEQAHPLYVERAELDRKIASENREPTPAEREKRDQLDAAQAAIYQPAWDAAMRRMNSSRGIKSASSSKNVADTNPPSGQVRAEWRSSEASLSESTPNTALGENSGSAAGRSDTSAMGATSTESVPPAQGAGETWSRFAPDSGTLGIPRAEMPQIKAKDRGAFLDYLDSKGIGHVSDQVPPSSLKPTQAEFSPTKVEQFGLTGFGKGRSVMISSDGHVLDGHHQWLAHRDAGLPIPVIRINAPIRDVLKAANEFPQVQRSPGAEPTVNQAADLSIVETPLAQLSLSKDVPQFKEGADENGVVEKLGGKYDRRGTGPIQVWRRRDGKLEIISGRHRFDLARRSGEETIPAQIYNEADGFSAADAAALDAELNIRDGQGKVADYVQYFQHAGITQAEADARGLLARATGKRAFGLATEGAPELIAAHRAGRLTDEAATQIAHAAPGDERLQVLGMKLVQDGKPIALAANTMHAVKAIAGDRPPGQNDMFGLDDSAMRDADAMARVAMAKQRELKEQIAAVAGAVKRPDKAKALGVNVKDPAAVQRRVDELKAEASEWERWSTDPRLMGEIRSELGLGELPSRADDAAPAADADAVDDVTAPMFSRDASDAATTDMFGAPRATERAPARPADTTGDMFGGPTTRDHLGAAERTKDAQRNGLAGGKADAGDGGLFDGKRPEQVNLTDTPKTSRDASPGERVIHSTDQVRAAARKGWGNRFITKLERAGVLHFLTTDEAVARGLAKSADELAGVKGLYVDGKAYVITDQVRDLANVPGIVVHEAGLHYGYDRLTTQPERQALRNRVNRALAAGDKDVVAAWKHAEKVGTPAKALHEEAMAYLVENAPGHDIVTRVVDAVKRGLNRAGVPLDLLETDSEAIRRTARDMLRRAANPAEKAARVRVEPEGVQPWRASSIDGAPVFSRYADQQTQTPEFKRWFGDSKVTDAEGNPLVLYHGTPADIAKFKPGGNNEHESGRAIWLTDEPDNIPAAHHIGGWNGHYKDGANTMPLYVKMDNPLRIDGDNAEQRNKIRTEFGDGLPVSVPRESAYKIMDAGYDGIIFKQKNEPSEYVVFDSTQVKSAISNVGTFDASNPDIRFSRDLLGDDDGQAAMVHQQAAITRQSVLSELAAQGYGQGALGWTGNPNEYGGWRGGVQSALQKLADKMDPVKRVEQSITEATGRSIADDADAYRLENLMHGRVADRLDALDRTLVKPLLRSMKEQKLSPDLLQDYLYARHAPERNARIASINKGMPDGGSGMSTQLANDILAGKADGVYSGQRITPDNLPALKLLAARVDRMREQTLATLESSGQITPALAASLRKQWQHYIPLRGKEGDAATGTSGQGAGRGVDIKGKPVKRALGRGDGNVAPNTILAEMVGDAQRAIIQAEKARVGRAILKLAAEHPNPDVWQVEPVDLEWKFSESTGETYLAARKPTTDKDVLTVVHDGTPYHVRLKDPRLQEAVLNLGAEKGEVFVRWIGKLNRWLSAAFTRYSPAFIPINAMRDAVMGFSGLAAEHGAAVALSAAKGYFPAMRAAFRDARNAPGDASVPDPQKSMDDWAREFSESGGKTGIVKWERTEDTQKKLQREFERGMGFMYNLHANPRAAAAQSLQTLAPIIHAIEHTNDAVENAMRLSAYVALRKRGMSVDKAAMVAKDLTVNFNRKGSVGGIINSLFLFYNASVQGVRRSVQLMGNPKIQGFLGGLMALQASQTAILMARQDEDGISDWDAIPDYVKQRALIIALPGSGHYFAMPMPYEFGFLAYAGGRVTQWGMEKAGKGSDPSSHANVINDLGSGLFQSFSPIPLDNGFNGLIPTPLRIPVQVYANKNDFDHMIYNDHPMARYKMPAAASVRAGTAAPYVWMANALNRAGGGDDYHRPQIMQGMLDWSPNQLQFLVDSFVGGMGNFGNRAWGTTSKALAGNYKVAKDGTVQTDWPKLLSELPVLQRLGWNIDHGRAQSARFNDIEDNLERTRAQINDKLADGDFPGAQQAAREAGVFGDGWTIKTTQAGLPITTAKRVNGQTVRVPQLGVVPGTLAAAHKEAVNGLSMKPDGARYTQQVQVGLKDLNDRYRHAMTLPSTERERAIKQIRDEQGGLMGAFLRFYNQRKDAYDTAQSRQ